jgi:hypothetical protein
MAVGLPGAIRSFASMADNVYLISTAAVAVLPILTVIYLT